MVFERSGLAIAKEKMRKNERNKNKGKERIDDMMMMREFFGILRLGFPFCSISLLIRTIGKRREGKREKERNLRRDGKGRGQQRPASPQGISPRGIVFFYFIIMTGKLTMTFSLVSLQRSWIGRGACPFSFLFPFSFFFFQEEFL